MQILTLNSGSSSIKYKVFETDLNSQKEIYGGLIEGIGENRAHGFKSHRDALEHLKLTLKDMHFDVIAHRVVHGGEKYFKPTLITPSVREAIAALCELAPIHNPVNLQGIDFALEHFKDAQQVAIFDTGFHHTLDDRTKHYPIDSNIAHKHKILRYGFHGINHEYVARTAAKYLNLDFEQANFISLHLGNGASACLIKNGKSVDTSMGMTPLAGLMMGTRCGDIDPAIPLYLISKGYSPDEVDKILNKKSGLLGIGGDNDMRHLVERASSGDIDAQFAIDMYVYRIKNLIGAYRAHCPDLQGLIFTGGVGENAALIREWVIKDMHHLGFNLDKAQNNLRGPDAVQLISASLVPIMVIKGNEESYMATLAYAISKH